MKKSSLETLKKYQIPKVNLRNVNGGDIIDDCFAGKKMDSIDNTCNEIQRNNTVLSGWSLIVVFD